MTCARYLVGLLGLLWLPPSGYLAANPQPDPQELSQLAERVDTANRLFEEKKYQEALPVYQDVYERSREPTMLFSMGQCYRNLSRFQEAAASYQAFLREAPKAHELRPLAQQLLQEVEAKTPPTAPDAPTSKARALYLGAGAFGILGASAGVAAIATIFVAGERQRDGDIDDAQRLAGRAQRFAIAADVSVVASLGLVIGGFVLSKKEKKMTTSLVLGPSQATLRLEF